MWSYLMNPAHWILPLGTTLFTFALTPLIIRLAVKKGVVDHGGYRKIHGHQIPLMGGLAIVVPMLTLCVLGILYPHSAFSPFESVPNELLVLLLGGAAIAILGIVDDVRGLKAREKFIVQVAVALLVCFGGTDLSTVTLPLLGTINLGLPGGVALTVFWVVGIMNAFNLVDGVDGLASGLALMSAIGLGAVAALNGQPMVALICLGLSGCLIGFLIFNFHPAKIFLGDTGSLFLGFTLATLALMGSAKTSGSVMLLTPVLAMGFPIFDTITSIARRLLRGRNPFIGDCAHTHHRLLDSGYSQPQVALLLYGVALLCTVSAILCQVFYPQQQAPLIAVGIAGAAILLVAWLGGYLRLRHALLICRCRTRNIVLQSFSRFAALAAKANPSPALMQELLQIGCTVMGLRFIEIRSAENHDKGRNPILLGVSVKEADEADECELDPIEELRVVDAAGHRLVLRYQFNHRNDPTESVDEATRDSDRLEHQDVMACLAHLFNTIRLTGPRFQESSSQLPVSASSPGWGELLMRR